MTSIKVLFCVLFAKACTHFLRTPGPFSPQLIFISKNFFVAVGAFFAGRRLVVRGSTRTNGGIEGGKLTLCVPTYLPLHPFRVIAWQLITVQLELQGTILFILSAKIRNIMLVVLNLKKIEFHFYCS